MLNHRGTVFQAEAVASPCKASSVSRLQAGFSFNSDPLQVTVKARPADSQDLRRPQPVSFADFQNLMDVLRADLVKRKRAPIFPISRQIRAALQLFRQVA